MSTTEEADASVAPANTTAASKPAASPSTLVNDLSTSPAYTYLNQLLTEGTLTEKHLLYFKTQYQHVHESLLQTYTNERQLLLYAKYLKQRYEYSKQQYTTLQHSHTTLQTAITHEQQKLQSLNTTITQQLDVSNTLEYELQELHSSSKECHTTLTAKYHDVQTFYSKDIQQKQQKVEQLHAEHDKLVHVSGKEKLYYTQYEEKLGSIQTMIASLDKQYTAQQQALQSLQNEPQRLRLNCTMLQTVVNELTQENSSLQRSIREVEQSISTLLNERLRLQHTIEQHTSRGESMLAQINTKKQQLEDLSYLIEMESTKTQSLEDRMYTLQHTMHELKDEQQSLLLQITDRSKHCELLKKQYETLRRKKDKLQYQLQPLLILIQERQHTLNELNVQLTKATGKMSDIQGDEHLLLQHYQQQLHLESTVDVSVQKLMAEKSQLTVECSEHEKQLTTLARQINELKYQMEQTVQQVQTLEHTLRMANKDLQRTDGTLVEMDTMMQQQLQKLKTQHLQCEALKVQKNKILSLCHTSQQMCVEFEGKKKVLQSEITALQHEIQQRDTSLSAVITTFTENQQKYKHIQQINNTLAYDVQQQSATSKQQLLKIQHLQSLVQKGESNIQTLTTQRSRALEHRNMLGIQLVNQNDELVVLNEKSTVLQQIRQSGEVQLSELESRIAQYKTSVADCHRQLQNYRKQIPSLSVYASTTRTLEEVENRLLVLKQETEVMVQQLESPTQQLPASSSDSTALVPAGAPTALQHLTRIRLLPGADPSTTQLETKISYLEHRLANKTETSLEQNVVLAELEELNEKMTVQAAESKSETQQLAHTVSDLQGKLKKVARQMQATVSELSMYQARVMELESTIEEQQQLLEASKARMEAGDAPTDEAEYEYIKMQSENRRHHEIVLNAKLESEQKDNGKESVISPRANAYISEDLGLPKPYTVYQPFKPTQLGGQLRHYKVPALQPVII